MKNFLPLACWIIVFETVSFLIGRTTQSEVDSWYPSLTPPPLVPPNLAFPIVWTILYALIAAAGWLIWSKRNTLPRGKILLAVFTAYMALNWSWSFVFFGLHLLFAGLLWIAAIDALSLALIVLSWKQERRIAWLMIPPTLWTLFATYLNAGYWWLNS